MKVQTIAKTHCFYNKLDQYLTKHFCSPRTFMVGVKSVSAYKYMCT